MTKAEFYKSAIELHKKCGQGVSGIVKLGRVPEVSRWIDELIEEGLLKACDTGGSIGHPESNIFYVPTKGYNVWEDDDGGRYKGKYLTFVRLYLGALEDESEHEKGDIKRFINPSAMDLLRDADTMKAYAEWLERNTGELEEMLTLDEYYVDPVVNLSDDEKSFIKSKNWYKNDKKIKECLKESNEALENNFKSVPLLKQIIKLCKQSNSHKDDVQKHEDDLFNTEREIERRKKIHKWMEQQDQNANIKSLL